MIADWCDVWLSIAIVGAFVSMAQIAGTIQPEAPMAPELSVSTGAYEVAEVDLWVWPLDPRRVSWSATAEDAVAHWTNVELCAACSLVGSDAYEPMRKLYQPQQLKWTRLDPYQPHPAAWHALR